MADQEFDLDREAFSKVTWLKEQYLQWIDVQRRNGYRDRLEKNFRYYNGDQWDAKSLTSLNEQKRPAHTYNYYQGTIDVIQGQLEKTPLSTNFDAIQRSLTDEADIVQQVYDYDYERGDYEFKDSLFTRDGLIITGVQKMIIDYRHDPLGNIGWLNVNPIYVVEDPYWQSDDIMDCRGVYNFSWMTPSSIKSQFHKSTEQIKEAIKRHKDKTASQEITNKIADRSPEFYDHKNDQYLVIEFCYQKKVKAKRVFDTENGVFDERFDNEAFQNLSNEEFEYAMFSQGQSYKMVPGERTVIKVVTICPGISRDLILEDGDYPLQLGRLPYVFWAPKNSYGYRQGVGDKLIDPQDVLNKRESVATHMLGTAGNGNYLIEEDAFSDVSEEIKFKNKSSSGGQVFKVSEGAISQQKIKLQDRPQPPNEFWAAADRAKLAVGELGDVSPTDKAMSQGANETSLLFDAKKEESLTKRDTMMKALKKAAQEKGEMYFYAFKQVYSGPKRRFKNRKTGNEIIVNNFVSDENGNVVVINDVMNLKRHNVVIKEDMFGLSRKKENLHKYVELSKIMTNPILRAQYEKLILKYTDLPEQEVAKLEQYADDFTSFQQKQVLLQNKSIDAQLSQLEQPPQQQPQQTDMFQGLDAKQLARLPGLGEIPGGAGIAGKESGANNTPNSAPSDFVRR